MRSTLLGTRGPNEAYWEIDGDHISVLNVDRIKTVEFSKFEEINGKIAFRGHHIPNPNIILILRERGIARASYGNTRQYLENEIRHLGWSIGEHTYGIPDFIEKGMSRLVVGKYCSIANGCKISFGDHRTDFATSYPFASLRHYWKAPEGVHDHRSKGDVVIGHDVWIGSDVFIGSGVTIGSGSVIGGRSVVTKDVPAYAIAVGSPAKTSRHRFEPQVIEELLSLAWWDLDDDVVEQLLPFLLSTDIYSLYDRTSEDKGGLSSCMFATRTYPPRHC